jgi:peptide deformylase
MEHLRLRIYGDQVLRKKAEPVEIYGDELRDLVQQMRRIMRENSGVGLAAPQAGVSLRVAVFGIPREGEAPLEFVLVNPVIVERDGEVQFEEGCLSVPGVYESVRRAQRIVVTGTDEFGKEVSFEAEDMVARAIQHEIDHLDGVLFVDRVGTVRRRLLKRKLSEISQSASAG